MTPTAFFPFAILVAFQMAGETLCRLTHAPVPGPVAGALLLFIAMTACPKLHAKISPFSHTLLRNMLLFYVPACAGITQSIGDIAGHGLLLAAAIIASTWGTALASAMLLDFARRPRRAAGMDRLAAA